jgi:molecular chaperone DnaK (HSP70)
VFTSKNEGLVGHIAKLQAIVNPENTTSSCKRFICWHYQEVEEERATASYWVAVCAVRDAWVKVQGDRQDLHAACY